MHNGKYSKRPAKRRRYNKRFVTMVLSLLLLLGITIGGTLAYLIVNTKSVDNTFAPAQVTCAVTEDFTDGIHKKNVNVTNTGNVDAWLRVKLISYRVNDENERIGGAAAIPVFAPGRGWFEQDGFYYYTSPVAPGEKPAADLISQIVLKSKYDDPDGGKQVIEVMAEAIQADGVDADGMPAVTKAWGITVSNGSLTNS